MIKLFLRQITHDYKDELSPDIIYLVFRWIITCFDQNWFSVQLSIRPWRHAAKGIICSQILIKTKKEEIERIRVPLFCMDSWKDLEKYFATSPPQVHTLRHQWNVKTINKCITIMNFIYFVFNSITSSRWRNHFLEYILAKTLQMICTSSKINWSDQIGLFINYLVACTL